MARNNPTSKQLAFTGLRDASPADQVDDDALTVAENVHFTRALKVQRRKGTTEVFSGAVQALWGDGQGLLFSSGTLLYRLHPDHSTQLLGTLGVDSNYLHGARTPQGTAFTTGHETLMATNEGSIRALGLLPPELPAAVTVLEHAGALHQGGVMLALTAFSQGIGESGSSEVTWVQTPDQGALQVQLPSSSYTLRLYVSAPDGTMLYRVAEGAGGSTITFRGHTDRSMGLPLKTEGHGVLDQAADTLAVHQGRLLSAVHNVLWYSEAYAYERIDLSANFVLFPSPVRMLASTERGLFVATTKAHYYLLGDDLREARMLEPAGYGAPLGQPVTLSEHEHNFEGVNGQVQVQLWLSNKGMVAGFDGGTMLNLSESNVRFQSGTLGSVAMQRSAEVNQAYTCVRY